jgi:DnaK suppressor protein
MIVSILQLMGFPMGKPVHSRAGETAKDKSPKDEGSFQGSQDNPQASAARRQDVKAKSGKDAKAKAAGKAKAVVKAPAKTPAKAAKKPVAKAVAKTPVKKSAKPLPKAAAKTPTKITTKTPVKTPAKPAVKANKPVAKPVKATAKPVAKAAKPVTKTKPKVTAKPTPKPVAKPVAKAPVKPVKAAEKISKPVAKSLPKVKAPEPTTPVATKPVREAAPAPAAVPQKTGRPSSRLAQLTVPSMAQSVASTAAKASYSQVVTAPVIVPVLPSSIKKDPKLANNWKTKPANELTDAELMAMPDAEYMNEAQMGAFRHRLSILKRDILNSAGETTEHLREDTSVVPDPADRATIEEEHALELRTRDRERKLLKKIEQSIARIDSGDYGYCDETGEPIGVGRLLARPTASLSLEAQQRRELKQKMFGD